jgi:hypothetical protein
MKSPPEQYADDVARNNVEAFIKKYGRKGTPAARRREATAAEAV